MLAIDYLLVDGGSIQYAHTGSSIGPSERAMATSGATQKGPAVVLAHGLIGWGAQTAARMSGRPYFNKIEQHLRSRGLRVLAPEVDGLATSSVRGAQLLEHIRKWPERLPGERVIVKTRFTWKIPIQGNPGYRKDIAPGTSGVIAGVDFVGASASPGDCANMSLGGGISSSLDAAVINAAANSGAFFTLAAGNEGQEANNSSPARANGANVFTISAHDSSDRLASFSNYGNPPVDYAAPGVGVLSTKKGGGTVTYSGTSMAAPHACAVLMLNAGNPSTDGSISNDRDSTPDPIIHL